MSNQEKYILFLSQLVNISVKTVTTDEVARRDFETKLLGLFFSSLFNSLKDNVSREDINEISEGLKSDVPFNENLNYLLERLSEKVGEQQLGEMLFDEFEKFASTVLDITHKTLGPEASKEYDIQLAKLGQGFINID